MLIPACGFHKKIDSKYYCQKLNFKCVENNKIVYFQTSKGDFEVELFGKDNPVTVSNFLKNIKNNTYRNQKFYKIINFSQVKIIHAGIKPDNKYHLKKNLILNKIPQSIPLELKLKKEFEAIYNKPIKDPSKLEHLLNSFEIGSLAMAKVGDKSSSSTEFFFVTNKIPELDGRYSIFGKIVRGLDILEKIDKQDMIYDVKISN